MPKNGLLFLACLCSLHDGLSVLIYDRGVGWLANLSLLLLGHAYSEDEHT
jgi:hypothetical protein